MNQKLELTVKQARALCLIAPKNDVRHYMNGILCDFAQCRFVATNGHMLLATPAIGNPKAQEAPESIDSLIIPRDALDAIAKGGKATDDIEIDYDTDAGTLTLIRSTGMAMTVKPVDGRYPDIDRVVPHAVSNELAQYNGDYLATCQKALRLCADNNNLHPHMAHNGQSAGVMSSIETDTYAIIMPLRTSERADWITDKVKKVA